MTIAIRRKKTKSAKGVISQPATRPKPIGDSSSTTSTRPRPAAAVCGEACLDAIVDLVVEMVFGLFDLTWVSFGESED